MSVDGMSKSGSRDDIVKRSRILAILPSVPWPVRRSGFSLRYFPLLRHLCTRHEVDLLVLGDRDAWADLGPLADWCRVTKLDVGGPARTQWQRFRTIARGVFPGSAPYALRSAWTSEITAAVSDAASRQAYDVLLWAGPAFLEAALEVARMRPANRCVYDLVDSPTVLERRGNAHTGADASAQFAAWEARIQEAADLTIYISAADAQAVQGRVSASRKTVIPNGLFLEDFGSSDESSPVTGRYLLFFGHMSYHPNVDAARRLALEIMPEVRKRHPDVRLVVMGHQPAEEVLALQDEHTIVTGSVASIWPYVRGAAACVFPLRLGTGLQNKILEALAAGKPVVTTAQCAASLTHAVPGGHLLVADSTGDIVNATLGLLDDPASASRLGQSGQALVRNAYDWNAIAHAFERALLAAEGA